MYPKMKPTALVQSIDMKKFSSRIPLQILTGVLILLSVSCAHIPKNPHKLVSYSHPPAEEGLLVEVQQKVLKEFTEEESAFLLIPGNTDALRLRLALIDHAQQSIDLQTFIWSNDESGRLILSRLIDASKRGVQIRLLVDDMPKDWSDRSTALVARMEHIQLRRFNPGLVRKGKLQRMFQMSTQFKQLNRRMHNKQMLVDGRWGIIGGRNLGNPYFGLSKKYNNRDLDLLVTGAAIPDMAEDFDDYWNAEAAYPGEAMSDDLSDKKIEKLSRKLEKAFLEDTSFFEKTSIAPNPIDWTPELSLLPSQMVKGTAHLMQDEPVVRGDRGIRLADQLNELQLDIQHQSNLITPYMIPSRNQLKQMRQAIRDNQHQIRILVPSMESNNHTMAHSHYKKYRKQLLEMGADLYEFKGDPSAEIQALCNTAPIEADFISLHTKAFAFDEKWVFIGSLNIDPRSIQINTEHLLLIHSPQLATQLTDQFDVMISPENAWTVSLNEKKKLRWDSDEGTRKRQPARGFTQRIKDVFYRILPIEGQL